MSHRAHIGGLLDALRPADARERGFVEAMRALVQHPACLERSLFQPGHFTASAFVLHPEAPALLLIHHRKLGRWLQPGGHIDAGDADPLASARREVEEETGVVQMELVRVGLLDVDVHDIPPLKGEPAHQHFDLRFLFRASGETLAPTAEVAGARWFPLDGLTTEFTDESVLRAVRKVRAIVGDPA